MQMLLLVSILHLCKACNRQSCPPPPFACLPDEAMHEGDASPANSSHLSFLAKRFLCVCPGIGKYSESNEKQRHPSSYIANEFGNGSKLKRTPTLTQNMHTHTHSRARNRTIYYSHQLPIVYTSSHNTHLGHWGLKSLFVDIVAISYQFVREQQQQRKSRSRFASNNTANANSIYWK